MSIVAKFGPGPASRRGAGAVALAALIAGLGAPWPAAANDFPTAERVIYVRECMQAFPGPTFEMIQKCACVLDRVAEAVSFETYASMSTIAKAMTIGGERGNDLRDNDTIKPELQRYRELQAKAQAACFIRAAR